MDSVIPKDLRLRGLAAACALMAAASCGGGNDTGKAAAPAASTDSAAAPKAAAPSAAASAPAPGARVDSAVLDSAMTPAEAAKVADAVQAPVQGPVNVEVLADYALTMPRVRRLVQGGQNLVELQRRRPELRDSMRIPTMDPNLLYQRLNSISDARDAIARAGLTPREYATGTAALVQAIMVFELERQGRPAPPIRYNEANVDFVAKNIQEIMEMMREAGAQMPQQGQQPSS